MVVEDESCKKDIILIGRVPQVMRGIAEGTIREFKHEVCYEQAFEWKPEEFC